MTNKFKKMCSIYKLFASDWDCDFSDQAMKECFKYETFGKGYEYVIFNCKKPNGYLVGKKWLNVQVSYWLNDMKESWYSRAFLLDSLFSDPKYKDHHDWLIKVLRLTEVFNNLKKELDYLCSCTKFKHKT